jgi:hypothetical protein
MVVAEVVTMTHEVPVTELFTQEFWDERNRSAEEVWSGNLWRWAGRGSRSVSAACSTDSARP